MQRLLCFSLVLPPLDVYLVIQPMVFLYTGKLQVSFDHMVFSQELLWRITKKQPSCAGDITHESTVRDVLEHFQGGKQKMITELLRYFRKGFLAVSAGRKHIDSVNLYEYVYEYTVRKLQDDVYMCVWLNICL